MATVVLFHSALGRRPAVKSFADELRAAGHTVHTPDLYNGEVFDDLHAGAARRDALGVPELLDRAHRAVAGLSDHLVYAGFSMGAAAAQALAATRPGAAGAVLVQGAVPLDMLGLESWPTGVPVQLHATTADPWLDPTVVDELARTIPEELVEVHRYDGGGHLVSDDAWCDHDPWIAARILHHVVDWLRDRQHGPSTRG